MRLLLRLRPVLEHRLLPYWLAALAVLLASPSITTGWDLDDYMQRSLLLMPKEELPHGMGRLDLFKFSTGEPGAIRSHRNYGFAPWWTPDDFKLAFWRPLASASHFVQYRLWPDSPVPMHLVSLVWLALLTILATQLFRRVIATRWIAGLAALLYTLQPGHAMVAGWVANQNSLMSFAFGLIAILAHDRWRVSHWKPGAVLGPLALGLAVLCGESGVAAGGYLLAYAIFLDPMRMHPRALLFIAPHFIVGLVWAAFYRMGGYGVSGSIYYLDPVGEPGRFAHAVFQRVPLLLSSIWALAPVSALAFFSDAGWRVAVGAAWAFTLIMLVVILPLVRHRPGMQFLAMGGALALLPICATMPGERNTLYAGFAAVGLLAQWMGSVVDRFDRAKAPAAGERSAFVPPAPRFAGWAVSVLLAVHFLLGPMLSLAFSQSYAQFKTITKRGYNGLLEAPELSDQTVILVNPPVGFMAGHFVAYRQAMHQPWPKMFRTLATSIYPLRLTRIDDRTVSVTAGGGGFLQPWGKWDVPGQPLDPVFNPRYLSQMMDRVFRDADHPFIRGEKVETAGMTAEVRQVSSHGGVNEVKFSFDRSVDDPNLRWVRWNDRHYEEFDPPAIGQSMDLPACDFEALIRP